MCGIICGYGGLDAGLAARMLRRIAHRGPDDEGSVEVNGHWLGHRRLSIVDVAGGKQPLTNQAGDLFLIGNGEIYNHQAVRQQFLDGVRFTTSSDNEVALHVVDHLGPDAISYLRGMFAFVIAGKDGRFVAARDPVGIKPLYWARRNEQILFASELRAYDPDWLAEAKEFPPGHYWTPDQGPVCFASAAPRDLDNLEKFAGPSEPGAPIPDFILTKVRKALIDNVELQMMGDVPVGVFLSGGLDSSLVAAIAARWCRRHGQPLNTFAVGVAGSPDLVAARIVAKHLNTEHHEVVYTARDALEILPEVVRAIEHFDPSLVRSAVPNYILAKFTAEHVKVVLTGEGADEIFAGYDYYEDFETEETLHAELIRCIESLHNLNLQRGDRVTMAHGLEARVPFLELGMIELGLSLPAGWKFSGPGQPEKRLLRQAFDGWLPHDLLWRKKAQFGDGSGASGVLQQKMEDSVTEEEFERERGTVDPPLRTREETAYYRIFAEHLGRVDTRDTIGRFATT